MRRLFHNLFKKISNKSTKVSVPSGKATEPGRNSSSEQSIKILSDSDLLTKYIFKSDEIYAEGGKPKPGSLRPKKGELLSMSETTHLDREDTCAHGSRHVDNPMTGRIHIGYVSFKHESFTELNIRTIYDNNPIRHVSVDFACEDEKRRELAKALADKAILVCNSGPQPYFAECQNSNRAAAD